jgi:hypothetical protein
MKIIEARMKLYNGKNHHTNGNPNCQSGNVDKRVAPVTGQTSEGGFEVAFKHRQMGLPFKSAIEVPVA